MQTLGIIDLIWKGQKLDPEKGAKFLKGGIKNNPVPYGRKVGRAQEFVPSEVTAVIPLKRGQRIEDIFGSDEGELQVICDTGQTYVAPDAFVTKRPEMTGGEGGKIEVTWSAGEMEEIL